MINQKSLYKKFKDLHNQTGTFILPNAWDVNSAKIFESFGFKAIGTTSTGCVFVPGVDDVGIIKEIVDNAHGPVNFLIGKNTPSVNMLSKLGVARLSTGSAPFRKVSTVLKELCVELQEKNTYERLTSEIIPYAEMFSHS